MRGEEGRGGRGLVVLFVGFGVGAKLNKPKETVIVGKYITEKGNKKPEEKEPKE